MKTKPPASSVLTDLHYSEKTQKHSRGKRLIAYKRRTTVHKKRTERTGAATIEKRERAEKP